LHPVCFHTTSSVYFCLLCTQCLSSLTCRSRGWGHEHSSVIPPLPWKVDQRHQQTLAERMSYYRNKLIQKVTHDTLVHKKVHYTMLGTVWKPLKIYT
jgi:hypothetical protein